MPFRPFDYGNVLAQAAGIQNARTQNLLAQAQYGRVMGEMEREEAVRNVLSQNPSAGFGDIINAAGGDVGLANQAIQNRLAAQQAPMVAQNEQFQFNVNRAPVLEQGFDAIEAALQDDPDRGMQLARFMMETWQNQGLLPDAGEFQLADSPDQLLQQIGEQRQLNRPFLAAAMYGRGVPAEVQTFRQMTAAGGLSEDEVARAARINLGLEARAGGGGMRSGMVRGADGLERPYRFNPQNGSFEVFDGARWLAADEGQYSEVPIPEGARMQTPPEQQSPVQRSGVFIGRSPEEQAQLTAERTPPTGYRFNERGELVPITGGPVAAEIAATEDAARKRVALIRQRGRTVLRDTQRALEATEVAGAAGPIAGQTAIVPGTPAFALQQHLDSIKSNISIDQLQQMRESSPTGGALGQVPVQQQVFLMQVLGSLDPRLPREVLNENLRDVYNIYLDAMYGDPTEHAEAVRDGRMTPEEADQLQAEREQTAFTLFGRRADVPRINSDADYQKLPSGSEFIAPDGTRRRKP